MTVQKYKSLVYKLSYKYNNILELDKSLEFNDLIQECYESLLKDAKRNLNHLLINQYNILKRRKEINQELDYTDNSNGLWSLFLNLSQELRDLVRKILLSPSDLDKKNLVKTLQKNNFSTKEIKKVLGFIEEN